MKSIPLTRGKFTIVDDEDYEWLNQWKWHFVAASKDSDRGYAARSEGGKKNIRMHRVLLEAPEGMFVDHINNDGLDNRRENLRLCTMGENNQNRSKNRNNKSGYLGVNWHKWSKKWRAGIVHSGKEIFIGYFDDVIKAAQAYDQKAREFRGELAQTNFGGSVKPVMDHPESSKNEQLSFWDSLKSG